ncbi:zinc-ribbon domain-containing protein [Actinomyces vulturis]|uniref:zinc-ribbon domain-containing protein n=1 Tax=Actinomyces vulturis TaxID=1857645 RepID=UPI0009F3B54F
MKEKLATEYSARNELSLRDVSPFSNRHFWWTCSTCGQDFLARLDHRMSGTGCPYCTGRSRVRVAKHKRVFEIYPELRRWWSMRNTCDPSTYAYNDVDHAYWFCSVCNTDFSQCVKSFTANPYCPCCSAQE